MRGAKRDNFETKLRHFQDERSFCSIDGHDYLRGKDVGPRRREVYLRDGGFCQVCRREGIKNFIGWQGEMHHLQGGLVGRHDDLENLEWVCPAHHRASHVQVKWTAKIIKTEA